MGEKISDMKRKKFWIALLSFLTTLFSGLSYWALVYQQDFRAPSEGMSLSSLQQITASAENFQKFKKDLRQTVQKNIQNNKEEFGKVLVVSYTTNPQGGRPAMLLDEEQFYIYCMISRSRKARLLHREFAKMIKGIRSKEFIHISELDKYRDELFHQQEALSKIPLKKLNRYKKFREMKLNRKEACLALKLPYATMKKVDRVLGYAEKQETPKALLPYVIRKGEKRALKEKDLFGEVQ